VVYSSTRLVWLHIPTAHTECSPQFCTCQIPSFRWGNWHSGGPVWWRFGLHATCWASLWSMGDGIGASPWLYWKLGSLHTAAVRCPSSLHTQLMLLQAMITVERIHWIGMFRCRTWGFSTRHSKGCRFSHMVNYSLVPVQLCGQLVSGVWESLPYHCWTRADSPSISPRYDLHYL